MGCDVGNSISYPPPTTQKNTDTTSYAKTNSHIYVRSMVRLGCTPRKACKSETRRPLPLHANSKLKHGPHAQAVLLYSTLYLPPARTYTHTQTRTPTPICTYTTEFGCWQRSSRGRSACLAHTCLRRAVTIAIGCIPAFSASVYGITWCSMHRLHAYVAVRVVACNGPRVFQVCSS